MKNRMTVERQKNKNRKTKEIGKEERWKEEWDDKRTVERQKENEGKKNETTTRKPCGFMQSSL